ncbi:hypothetical protein CASFOL_022661 [Castilleja foliolosa]|uniref:HTH myb-type domain-containing protein n=1 Tax=Castilleja foliolosa TaxID=1961234 RepID=A0ABD3CWE4_9LAMI
MAFEKNVGESSNSKHVNSNEGSTFVPKTISELDSYLRSYENELRKIDAFKHELPLCMQFLKNGIEKLKEEKFQCNKEKITWMSSFQLWTTPVEYQQEQGYFSPSMCDEEEQLDSEAFVAITKDDDEAKPVDDEDKISGGLFGRPHQKKKKKKNKKKQRCCWSPDLHRIFVHALDELGGAEVATPKKILEKMKVEGLTNDEVKSHLQKYRIHIRTLASASSAGPANSPWLTNNNMQENEVVESKSWGKQVDYRF